LLRDGNIHRLISDWLKNGRTGMGHFQNAIPHWHDFAKDGLAGFRMHFVVRCSETVL
jgi:hypothetical protein